MKKDGLQAGLTFVCASSCCSSCSSFSNNICSWRRRCSFSSSANCKKNTSEGVRPTKEERDFRPELAKQETHSVCFDEANKDGEKDRWRHRFGTLTKKLHHVFKCILGKKYWLFFFLFTQSGLVNRRMANKWTGQTWAMRASSCSFTSRDSFLLMKSLSVELCWTLNSLQVNSIPRWRSFTSHRTFSRLTDTQTHTGEGGSRSSQLCSNWLSHSPAAALST